MESKKGMAMETLGKWVLAVVFLALVVAGIITQRDKLFSWFAKLAEAIRFR